MIDALFTTAFASAYTAIFEIGSIMAVLMLLFGIIDYKKGDNLRHFIEHRKLDKPVVMAGLSLIPVDGTLLFQYNIYRKRSIRSGSLLGGIIGIGEEATYLILSYQPLAWLVIAVIKLLLALGLGSLLNHWPRWQKTTARLLQQDLAAQQSQEVLEADENFHALPDRFRHQMHRFRYHKLGNVFWIFFACAFLLQVALMLLSALNLFEQSDLQALGIPFVSWISMLALFFIVIYRLVVRLATRSFGKIFEHEFEDTGDAIGDLAETCASIILLIFIVTFAVQTTVQLVGADAIAEFFARHALLSVAVAALIGLVPGTAASLVFTSLYFSLAGSPGALPFASLVACSVALIGDAQFIGSRRLRRSQRLLHLVVFAIALLTGFIVWMGERLISVF